PGRILRNTSAQKPNTITIGSTHTANSDESQSPSARPVYSTPCASSSLISSGSSTRSTVQRSPRPRADASFGVRRRRSFPISTLETSPEATLVLNSEYVSWPAGDEPRASRKAAITPKSSHITQARRGAEASDGGRALLGMADRSLLVGG